MRTAMLLLLATTTTAAANQDFSMIGVGSSFANDDPGWMLRLETRSDAAGIREHDAFIHGGSVGLDVWWAGDHKSFNLPIGYYVGGQIAAARATVGGGIGLWAFDFRDRRTDGGVAPFVRSTIDLRVGKTMISLDTRLSRQVVDTSDFNVYSVIVMFGRRHDP